LFKSESKPLIYKRPNDRAASGGDKKDPDEELATID
jgi:hypothetical protein